MLVSVAITSLLTLAPLAAMANPVDKRAAHPLICYDPLQSSVGVAPEVTTSSVAPKPTAVAPKPAPVYTPVANTAPLVEDSAKSVQKGAPSISDKNFQKTCLNAHNSARAKHGAPALVWDNTLALAAQKWANSCIWQHSGGKVGPYGENMLGIWIPARQGDIDYPTSNAIAKSWYSEELIKYNFNQPGFYEATGHMTQVLWKGTTKVGCAWTHGIACVQQDKGKPLQKLFKFVCEYQSQGNIVGGQGGNQWFRQNVLPGPV